MKRLLNKKGSFAVFSMMIFTALIAAIWLIISASGDLAIASSVNSLGNLWGKSILAEYDLELRDRYGLLAFYGNQYETEEKLAKYMDYSLKEKSYITYEKPRCNLENESLLNTENLLEQIELVAAENLIYDLIPDKNVIVHDNGDELYRSISSQWIIENLPSYNKAEDLYVLELASRIKEEINLEDMVENEAVNRYIFSLFNNYMESGDLDKSYFNCEVEYIITGKFSDTKLKSSTGSKIKLLRNILNLFYLYSCQEKRDSAMALASSMTPGAMAFVTQGVLLEAWAYAEAQNDLRILYDNEAVPLLKKDCNWALSIENALNTEEQKGYIKPQQIEGIGYVDYLRVLLYGVTQETKLLRILDLIQINLKYSYCDYFLIKDCYCGLSYSLNVNGKDYEFKDTYIQQ